MGDKVARGGHLRWSQQAGALFIHLAWRPRCRVSLVFAFVVATVVPADELKNEGHFACISRVSTCQDLNSELCHMRRCIWEDVIITSPSPKIEFLSSIDHFQHLINRKTANCLTPNRSLWRGTEGRWQPIGRERVCGPQVREIPIARHWSIKYSDVDVVLHASCWGIAGILPNRSEVPGRYFVCFQAFICGGFERNRNESPLPSDQSTLGYFSGLFGGVSGFLAACAVFAAICSARFKKFSWIMPTKAKTAVKTTRKRVKSEIASGNQLSQRVLEPSS